MGIHIPPASESVSAYGRSGLRRPSRLHQGPWHPEPITTLGGEILDGRNRFRASQAAGVTCPIRQYDGDDPVAFVVSTNLHRRRLNESQRSWVASKIANLTDGQRADRVAGSIDLTTAAQMLNVSEKSIKRAKAVQRDAEPELQAAVEQGKIAVSLAANAAKLPQISNERSRCAPELVMIASSVAARRSSLRAAK
jgi:hypothetical protein